LIQYSLIMPAGREHQTPRMVEVHKMQEQFSANTSLASKNEGSKLCDRRIDRMIKACNYRLFYIIARLACIANAATSGYRLSPV